MTRQALCLSSRVLAVSACATGLLAGTAAPAAAQTRSPPRAPVRVTYTKIEYPINAIAQTMPGDVTVRFIVGADGHPRSIRVMEATAPGVFERATVHAVRRWRYHPVLVNGRPVEVPLQLHVRFQPPI